MARTTLTPAERKARARLAALARWKKHDPKAGTAPARAAFNERFINEVDPARELPEAERARRAECAMREHMARIGFQALKTRRQNATRKAAQQQRTQLQTGGEAV